MLSTIWDLLILQMKYAHCEVRQTASIAGVVCAHLRRVYVHIATDGQSTLTCKGMSVMSRVKGTLTATEVDGDHRVTLMALIKSIGLELLIGEHLPVHLKWSGVFSEWKPSCQLAD